MVKQKMISVLLCAALLGPMLVCAASADAVEGSAEPNAETIAETVVETVPETVTEIETETAPETVAETAPETVPETVPETEPETQPVTESETQSAAGEEAGSEPVTMALPAASYTAAAPLLLTGAGTAEDGLVLTKTAAAGEDGTYTVTLEAYATGEVHTETTETAVPTDIVCVLDRSGSMDWGFQKVEADNLDQTKTYLTPITNWQGIEYVTVSYGTVQTGGGPGGGPSAGTSQTCWHYTRGGQTICLPEGGKNLSDYSFYARTRLSAVQEVMGDFVDSVAAKAAADQVEHRIALVSFGGSSSILSGDKTASGAFVSLWSNGTANTTGTVSLKTAVNELSASGATRADLALSSAAGLFSDNGHSHVVIFLTDGEPTSGSSFEEWVANAAIAAAGTLKSDHAATVYSIGIFDGADPVSGADNANKFLHYVSSNYQNAQSMTSYGEKTGDGYYLSAHDTASLSGIFEKIQQSITVGGTAVTLGESAVLRDFVTPYFDLTGGEAHTVDYAGNGTWSSAETALTLRSEERTASVTGFDYSKNFVYDDGEDFGGKKLVVTLTLQPIEGFLGGDLVPTNLETSGIYQGDDCQKAFPLPTVSVPLADYNGAVCQDQSHYLLGETGPGLVTLSALDGVKNAFVDVCYTVTGGNPVKIAAGTAAAEQDVSPHLTGLTEDRTVTVSCLLSSVNNRENERTASRVGTAEVYVWLPTSVFRDSVIDLGDTADYADNGGETTWSGSGSRPAEAEPTLRFAYSPEAGAFLKETPVTVSCSLSNVSIDEYLTKLHEECREPGCGFAEENCDFLVHVRPCRLTIQKTGVTDGSQATLFRITGKGVLLTVEVLGSGSVTVGDLPKGTYTVTELTDWSYRYTPKVGVQQAAIASSRPGSLLFENERTKDTWLGGESFARNLFAVGSQLPTAQ